MFKVTLVAFLVLSASFSSSIVDNSLSDNSEKRDISQERYFFIEADEAFLKCACSIKYLYQLFAADRYLHAVIRR